MKSTNNVIRHSKTVSDCGVEMFVTDKNWNKDVF